MAIHLRIADSAKEIDDALWVRHEVFVVEDGKFGGTPLPGERIVDRFDSFPNVYNVVAYDEGEPIATIRLLKESPVGLPAFEYFDFSEYRAQVERDYTPIPNAAGDGVIDKPVFGSAGMLAIRGEWRRRRDVIRAMFRIAATVCESNDATHVVVAVNHETATMYRRLRFEPLSEKIWVDSVQNYVVPLASSVRDFYDWAFGDLPETPLGPFKDNFDRLVVRAGETIFREGDVGDRAYVVESGNIRISRQNPSGSELTLTHLTRGDLFGELALVDNQPRSATVVALTDTELMSLDRETFHRELRAHPERSEELFKIFASRIRRMDELALILAFAPIGQRLKFALELARRRARPDRKNPDRQIFRGGASELALLAAVDKDTAEVFLEECESRGELEVQRGSIAFTSAPEDDSVGDAAVNGDFVGTPSR